VEQGTHKVSFLLQVLLLLLQLALRRDRLRAKVLGDKIEYFFHVYLIRKRVGKERIGILAHATSTFCRRISGHRFKCTFCTVPTK
jgi:hypothetical protein